MISELLVKCVVLIAVVHGLRAVGRRIGPRASGLILGLPSSTAIILFLCGRERGGPVAVEMARSSLLGLVAAVSVPLAYAQAVGRGWPLPGSIAAALAAYLAVATGLGSLQPAAAYQCLGISVGAILFASYLAGRIDGMIETPAGFRSSRRWSTLVRTAIPVVYVVVVGIVGSAASPGCAGLVSTFPSMSTVLLIVTHLEEGPAEASRIARTLPLANLSTAAFLAAFRFGCPILGLGWGTFFGYAAALINLAVIERAAGRDALRKLLRARRRRSPGILPGSGHRRLRAGIRSDVRSTHDRFGRYRPSRRRRFAPHIEVLTC
jgi:hypothetical protein